MAARWRDAASRRVGILAVNELVDALRYAVPGGRGGTVGVIFGCRDGDCALTVRDDGIGIGPAAPPAGTGLGRRMVHALVAPRGGSFQVRARAAEG